MSDGEEKNKFWDLNNINNKIICINHNKIKREEFFLNIWNYIN